MAARLTLHQVNLRFGGVKVLEDVGFEVQPGEVFGLVGPNGAGKTSLFNCISGHYRPSSGSIRIDEEEVLSKAPWRMSRLGLARTFQHPALQLHATVLENVMLGAHPRLAAVPSRGRSACPRRARTSGRSARRRSSCSTGSASAGPRCRTPDEMSHGLHKGIELCRAMLLQPRLLLLDEPAAGLPHSEVDNFIDQVRRMRTDFDVTIVIVEHHMGLISALTDRVVVLDHGRKLMEGTAAEAQADARVIEAYIGKDAADDAA